MAVLPRESQPACTCSQGLMCGWMERRAGAAPGDAACAVQDNAGDVEEEGDAQWRRTVRAKEMRDEREADERDRLAELEEAAAARDIDGHAASVLNGGATRIINASDGTMATGIVDASDGIMAAMLAQAAKPSELPTMRAPGVAEAEAALPAASSPMQSAPAATGPSAASGWSGTGVAGATSAQRPTAAPVATAAAAAVKKQFFDDSADNGARPVGAWILQEAAKREAAPAPAQATDVNGAATFDSERDAVRGARRLCTSHRACHAAAAVRPLAWALTRSPAAARTRRSGGTFTDASRAQLMKRIPKTLDACKAWPLQLRALRLNQPERKQGLHKRVAKYIHEVMPEDEDEIAGTVSACALAPSHSPAHALAPSTRRCSC